MKEYADYLRETKRMLRNYRKMKVAVTNLTEEIEAVECLLRDEGIAAVRYGDDRVNGGAGELTSTEAAAERRIRMQEQIAAVKERREEIERTVRAIERVLASLNAVEMELIRAHYIEGATWEETARRLSYTEKWTQVRGWKALHDVAMMLFGVQVRPVQMRLSME
nr:MAG TPA: Protein of unknown function (DUF722) [Caudoviricetes sp.]DAQ20541.1 MAG TPA: Protein of unknown function (DUF722) [Caudoviricetes sp.]